MEPSRELFPEQYIPGLLDRLSSAERTRVAQYLEEVEIASNQVLLEQGRDITYAWLPIDCVTATVVRLPDGGEVEVGNMGAEGLIGLSLLFGVKTSNSTVVCQVPGSAHRMTAADMVDHVIEPRGEFYEALMRYANAFMAVIAQVAGCNTTHDVPSRLARWILMTQDRVRQDTLRLTHEFLGRMLGVQRSTVTLALRGLSEHALIEHSYGAITILDRQGLERASCPCYAIIRNVLRHAD